MNTRPVKVAAAATDPLPWGVGVGSGRGADLAVDACRNSRRGTEEVEEEGVEVWRVARY